MTFGGWSRIAGAALLVAAAALLGAGAGSPAAPPGGYTRAPAADGQYVYVQYCLRCHGANLQGADGAPLQGPQFGRSLATGKMTTPALYSFIHGAMPLNAPGRLSDKAYL